jgi:hypothetical protein
VFDYTCETLRKEEFAIVQFSSTFGIICPGLLAVWWRLFILEGCQSAHFLTRWKCVQVSNQTVFIPCFVRSLSKSNFSSIGILTFFWVVEPYFLPFDDSWPLPLNTLVVEPQLMEIRHGTMTQTEPLFQTAVHEVVDDPQSDHDLGIKPLDTQSLDHGGTPHHPWRRRSPGQIPWPWHSPF